MKNNLNNEKTLLLSIIKKAKKSPEIYQAGPYWRDKAFIAENELLKFGLSNFRGFKSNIGNSFADNAHVDITDFYFSYISRLFGIFMKRCPLISRVFNAQIALTKAQWEDNLLLKQQIINNSLEIQNLLSKFKMPSDTLRGNCVDYIDIDGEKISTHYLQLLHTHSVLSQEINFSEVRGFFEIGGGFGANIHLLVENYPNIKKFIYLDISPNLYVAAQYLKSFYGSAVKLFLDKEDTIFFLADDSLEILCILPEQIEKLNVEIDCFYNAHSFVEMPEKTVQMYIKNINRMLSKKNNSSIALVSYDGFELNTTFDPDNLTGFFEKKMSKRVIGSLFNPDRNYFYFTYKS